MGALRIIAGSVRGRRIAGPRGEGLRPTSDRVRQVVFDVLGQTLPGGEVLDLYAGTGALGLEALSRGAAHARLVDRATTSLALCRQNAEALGFADLVDVVRADLPAGLARMGGPTADWLFADPPYADAEAARDLLRVLAASCILSHGGVAVIEHTRRNPLDDRIEGAHALTRTDQRRFGETLVSFYRTGG